MNNFKLTYSYNGTTRDITGITSNYTRGDQIDQLGEEFDFDLIDNPLDVNYQGNRLEFGGKICFENNGQAVYTESSRMNPGKGCLSTNTKPMITHGS